MLQSEYLSILSRTEVDPLKQLAESLLPLLEPVTVIQNRTGLVMLPYTDNAQGTVFHLGEVLVSEAHIRILSAGSGDRAIEGYGMCLGRDLMQAVAIAVLDAAITAGINVEEITAFVAEQAALHATADDLLLRSVESTRVEMQTF